MASIPWGTILKNAPAILAAADALLAQARRNTMTTELTGDIQLLQRRVAELDHQQRAAAELVRQLADQINSMALAADASARRVRQAYAFGIAGTILGIVGCLLAILL